METVRRKKRVFVTVGTTSFDKLIDAVTDLSTIKILSALGYEEMTVQIGRGVTQPSTYEYNGFKIELYRYKTSIYEDILHADLIISHAGAGSCLEVLEARKPLVVVINEDLMANHQMELAKKLYDEGHLLYSNCNGLPALLKNMQLEQLKPLIPGRTERFVNFLDNVMCT